MVSFTVLMDSKHILFSFLSFPLFLIHLFFFCFYMSKNLCPFIKHFVFIQFLLLFSFLFCFFFFVLSYFIFVLRKLLLNRLLLYTEICVRILLYIRGEVKNAFSVYFSLYIYIFFFLFFLFYIT